MECRDQDGVELGAFKVLPKEGGEISEQGNHFTAKILSKAGTGVL